MSCTFKLRSLIVTSTAQLQCFVGDYKTFTSLIIHAFARYVVDLFSLSAATIGVCLFELYVLPTNNALVQV